QAEDGIRDLYVTGVQTCALPISATSGRRCSSACTVFFECEIQLIEGAPDRGQAGGRPQRLADLRQRRIGPCRDQRRQAIEVGRRQRTPAKFYWPERRECSRFASTLFERIDPRAAHVIPLGELLRR